MPPEQALIPAGVDDELDGGMGFDENAEQTAKALADADDARPAGGVRAATMDQLAQIARVDNFEEIARRKEAKEGRKMVMRDYTKNVGFNPLPERLRDHPHGFILCAVTGPGHSRPKSPYPGVMFLAYFGHEKEDIARREAVMYATKVVSPRFNLCDLRLVPIDRWTLVASTPEKMADEEYCMGKMEANMNRYYDFLRTTQRGFVKKVEEVTGREILSEAERGEDKPTEATQAADQGEEGAPAQEQSSPDKGVALDTEARRKELKRVLAKKRAEQVSKRLKKEVKEKSTGREQMAILGLGGPAQNKKVSARMELRSKLIEEEGMKNENWVPPLPGDLLRRSQTCAAVCFLQDTEIACRKGRADREPMFRVLKVYADVAAAEKDISENLFMVIGDFHMEVVDMGEWLYPEDVNYDKIENFKYRDQECQNVMKNRQFQNQSVKKHEADCKDLGIQPEEIFLKSAEAAKGISVEEYYARSRIKTVEEAEALAAKEAALKSLQDAPSTTTTTSSLTDYEPHSGDNAESTSLPA
jgi:hypothetical protein